MSAEVNTAQLRRLTDEVLTRHNLAALDEIFHADYVQDEPPPGMGPGRDGLRQWLASWIAAFPDVRWTVEEQIADDDRVLEPIHLERYPPRSFSWHSSHGKECHRGRVDHRPVHRRQDSREPDHHGHTRDDAATWCHLRTRSAAALIKLSSSLAADEASNAAAIGPAQWPDHDGGSARRHALGRRGSAGLI